MTNKINPKNYKITMSLFFLFFFFRQQALCFPLEMAQFTSSKSPSLDKIFLQDGDLVFQSSTSSQSQVIQLVTHSMYSHMGMIFLKQGKPFVLEAVQPVKFTPFTQWVARGKNGHVVVKRLQKANSILTPPVLQKMQALAQEFLGKDYDLQFQWDDKKLYCSELVYKLYERAALIHIGTLQRMKDFSLNHPLVQKKLEQRFGKNKATFHPNEFVISPKSMFDDPKLITIFTNSN